MEELDSIKIRNAKPWDHQKIISVIPSWWGGRDLSASVPKLFLMHFSNSCFIAEKDSQLCGFLIGFRSQTYTNEGYIHFVGVDPGVRKIGLARTLYKRFYEVCLCDSRTIIKSCTSPVNKLSIAFHKRMGFSIEPGDSFVNDVPVTNGYLRDDDQKVLFTKVLSRGRRPGEN